MERERSDAAISSRFLLGSRSGMGIYRHPFLTTHFKLSASLNIASGSRAMNKDETRSYQTGFEILSNHSNAEVLYADLAKGLISSISEYNMAIHRGVKCGKSSNPRLVIEGDINTESFKDWVVGFAFQTVNTVEQKTQLFALTGVDVIKESIDLTQFSGSNLEIRVQFLSNHEITRPGVVLTKVLLEG
jgi:hypothetical protein